MKYVYIISGGTFIDVAPHFAVSARAFGTIGRTLKPLLELAFVDTQQADVRVHLILTRMALGGSERSPEELRFLSERGLRDIVTNQDIAQLVESLVQDQATRAIIMTAALTDFEATSLDIQGHTEHAIGKDRDRLESSKHLRIDFQTAPKILETIRRDRKDIFLVACKTTAGATANEQYLKALKLLKTSSCNLVLANDIRTHLNMIVTPEQARYHESTNRNDALAELADMIALRSNLTFTRSTVIAGDPIPWSHTEIPRSLRATVDHCIVRGAYKPFNGVTVGHFASRGTNGTILTSRRKTDFNRLPDIGLVRIEPHDHDLVIAHGSKPSVGGQSQRIIFNQHPDVDCIVHMHCPLLTDSLIPVRSQRPFECGSHECGQNTSDGLTSFGQIKAVMLDQHGPNIVFPRDIDPRDVIEFIESNIDLAGRTDGVNTSS